MDTIIPSPKQFTVTAPTNVYKATTDCLPDDNNNRDMALPDELEDLSRFEGEGGLEAYGCSIFTRHSADVTSNETDSMKPELRIEINRRQEAKSSTKPTPRSGVVETPENDGVPKPFRRLKWNEVVSHGDFVADERLGLQPWEGLGGFQAGSFARPIYRKQERRPTGSKKIL